MERIWNNYNVSFWYMLSISDGSFFLRIGELMNKKYLSLVMVTILLSSLALPSLVAAGPSERKLEKRVIIHYKKGYGKPEGKPDKPVKNPRGDYELLGKGVKWKTTPELYIDPDNGDSLTENFITSTIAASVSTWNTECSFDLDGGYTIDYSCSWDDTVYDYRNEVLFGDYHDDNVIAITVVWGFFGGPPKDREIIEFDILFNDYWDWGDVDEDGLLVMDLQNIATHELGHGYGLDDLDDPRANLETMYGFSELGDIVKRDLYYGDIRGIQKLYN